MARQSTIALHPQRALIDAALANGTPIRAIASRFGVGRMALHRYRQSEFLPMLARVAEIREAREIIHADTLADQVRRLETRALDILAQAEAAGSRRDALAAIAQARACLETRAKIAGELSEHQTQVNVLISPEWTRVRAALITALAPYPEARPPLPTPWSGLKTMRPIAADLALALDPARIMAAAGISEVDPWQQTLLRSTAQTALVLASRQSGKSTAAAALAMHTAMFTPKSLVLIFSPSFRQSNEMLTKIKLLARAFSDSIPGQESTTKLGFGNGARILSLPGESTTVRGFSSPDVVILDEAAYISDDLLNAVSPMLAVGGRLVAITTPAGSRGWFYELWTHGPAEYLRLRITADDCPRITPEFLAAERQRLSERAMRQEYGVEFCDTDESVFSTAIVRAAVSEAVRPLTIDW